MSRNLSWGPGPIMRPGPADLPEESTKPIKSSPAKDCPFCGNRAEERNIDTENHTAKCSSWGKCRASRLWWDIDDWNRRVPKLQRKL